LRFWSLPAGREQRGCFGLAFQEGLLEVVGTFPDLVECAEHGEQARSWFSDEVQVLAGVDAQALQDGWQVIRNGSFLALDDRAAGPVDQLQVVVRGIGNGFFGAVFTVALEAEELDDGLVKRGAVGGRFPIVDSRIFSLLLLPRVDSLLDRGVVRCLRRFGDTGADRSSPTGAAD